MAPRKTRAGTASAAAAVQEIQPDKENVVQSPTGVNLEKSGRNWEAELEAMTTQLNKMKLEKEACQHQIQEQAAKLEEQEAKLALHNKEHEQLKEKLKKLSKKEFQPLLTMPLPDESSDDSKGKKKKKNDTDRVKRPVSSFLLWCGDQRDKLRAEFPDMSAKDMTVKLGEIWKTVSAEEKQPYEAAYQKNKEEYLKIVGKERREAEGLKLLQEENSKKISMELLEQFMEYKKETQAEMSKGKKKEKDPEKPKRAMTSYLVFSEQRRPELMAEKKMTVPQVGKALGAEWSKMDAEARAPYEKIALEKKNEYLAEMEVYKKKKAEEDDLVQKAAEEKAKRERVCGMQLLKEKEKADEVKKAIRATRNNQKTGASKVEPEGVKKVSKGTKGARKVKTPGEPSKPPSAYILFGNDYRKQLRTEMPGASAKQMTALVGSKWKEMSDGEKQPYVDQAAVEKQKYEAAVEEYKKPSPDVQEDDESTAEDGDDDNEECSSSS